MNFDSFKVAINRLVISACLGQRDSFVVRAVTFDRNDILVITRGNNVRGIP